MTVHPLPAIRELLAGVTPGPWFLNDCDGEVIVLPEADLTMVSRDDDGVITSWGLPTSYRPERRILEVELDTWDEGEDEQDDQVRANAAFIAAAPSIVAQLLAVVERVEGVLTRLDDEIDNSEAGERDAAEANLGAQLMACQSETFAYKRARRMLRAALTGEGQ